MRILLIEDDCKMADLLKQGLCKQTHTVVHATDGREGLDLALHYEFEVIILDFMLPSMDGPAVANSLRKKKILTPVLMLTARDSMQDIVHGFESGADDYLTKPFAFVELFARLQAISRRQGSFIPVYLQIADLTLDPLTRNATRAGTPISLTKTEFSILEFLMRNPSKSHRRDSIINAIWGYEDTVETNTLDVFMKQLRAKIDGGQEVKLIHTIRGFGYRLGESVN